MYPRLCPPAAVEFFTYFGLDLKGACPHLPVVNSVDQHTIRFLDRTSYRNDKMILNGRDCPASFTTAVIFVCTTAWATSPSVTVIFALRMSRRSRQRPMGV